MAEPVSCAGGCGKVVPDDTAAEAAGWEFLPISRRYRCGQCTRELQEASKPKEKDA